MDKCQAMLCIETTVHGKLKLTVAQTPGRLFRAFIELDSCLATLL